MPNNGTGYADKAQAEIEKRLREIYGDAQKELVKKLDEHTKQLSMVDKVMRQKVADGQLTQKQYDAWLYDEMFKGKVWRDKVDSLSETMLHANEQANAIIEGKRKAVFGKNYLYQAKRLSKDTDIGISFDLYDSATVTRLLRDQPELLPRRRVDKKKDKAWNRENIANAVTQGIIEGDSIPDLARRIAEKTAFHNRKATERYARTAMTGAQNAGRMEMLHEAQSMGIRVKKVWLATLDSRTRDAHALLDGQEAEVDEPFESELGDIMYPGDPAADPANTWNCRCTLIYKYDGYGMHNVTRYDQENRVVINALGIAIQEMKKGRHVSDFTVGQIRNGDITCEELLANEIGCTIKDAQEYVNVIQAFSGNEHIAIRKYQQKRIVNQDEIDYIKPRERLLEDFISKGFRWSGGKTYRAIGLTDEELSDIISKARSGRIIPMRGSSSWSSKKEVAENHNIPKNNRVIFISDTQKQGTSIMAYSESNYEYEVLVSKRARYKAVSYHQENGITYITLEEQ